MRSKNKAARKKARAKRQSQAAHAKAMVELGPVPDVFGVEELVTRLETGWAAEYAPMVEYVASLGDPVSEPHTSKCKSKCKKCGLPLAWKTLPSGKMCPTNPDGSDHWDICRATQNAGRPFDPERDTKTSGQIVGKDFVRLPPLPAGEAPWN